MNYSSVRRVFESFSNPADSPETRTAGAYKFVESLRGQMGLTVNEYGRPTIDRSARKMMPSEFSIKGLAESLCGYDWVQNLEQSASAAHRVFEAGGNPAMTPGNFANVSAFLGSVTGMLEAAILDSYDVPEFIIDKLIPTQPSKVRQHSMIGMGRIGDQSRRRNPGDGHTFAQFAERYIRTTPTENDALAGSVTFEAVYYDLTGQILATMNNIGRELALRKELDGFKLIAGVTNPYNYNGVAYNTYLTSGNWINDLQNEMEDWTDLNLVKEYFSRMTDQETGNRIAVSYDTYIVSPAREETAKYITRATQVEKRTDTSAIGTWSNNQVEAKNIVSSVYLDQILTTAVADGGLALSQANANKYWWALKTGKGGAFVRTENWGLTINRAAPNDFTMLNQKLLLAVFADQMHSFDVVEPRFVIRNKNA